MNKYVSGSGLFALRSSARFRYSIEVVIQALLLYYDSFSAQVISKDMNNCSRKKKRFLSLSFNG